MEDKALEFIRGKYDEIKGNAYVSHALIVSGLIKRITVDPDTIIASLLHDVLYSSVTTYDELVTEFGTTIADIVNELTPEGDIKGECYYPRLHSKNAIMIMLSIRLAHFSKFGMWDKATADRYLRHSKFWKSEIIPPTVA